MFNKKINNNKKIKINNNKKVKIKLTADIR